MTTIFCQLKKNQQIVPYFMWVIALLFFAHQFILRLWPGLMMEPILNQFAIDATDFGTIAAFYYYGYAGMQIPVAILLERFGPRIIICIFALVCGVAAIVFTYTNQFYVALISRFFIGAGSAVGFLGVSKVISQWFDPKLYTRMVGFSFSFGLLGAVYGGKPVGILIENYNPKGVAYTIGAISIIIAGLAYLFLRQPKSAPKADSQLNFLGLKAMLSSKTIWIIAVANLLLVGALEGFADVWGVQYLIQSYGIAKSDAAGLISFIFIGMLFGGPTLAWISEKLGKTRVIALSGFLMALIFIAMLLGYISLIALPYCFFIIGIVCCYQVLVFALGSQLVSAKNLGICIAFLNSINMLGGSFYHTIIGRTMDIFWGGAYSSQGCKIYEIISYQFALSVIPLCGIIGSFIFLGFERLQKKSTFKIICDHP